MTPFPPTLPKCKLLHCSCFSALHFFAEIRLQEYYRQYTDMCNVKAKSCVLETSLAGIWAPPPPPLQKKSFPAGTLVKKWSPSLPQGVCSIYTDSRWSQNVVKYLGYSIHKKFASLAATNSKTAHLEKNYQFHFSVLSDSKLSLFVLFSVTFPNLYTHIMHTLVPFHIKKVNKKLLHTCKFQFIHRIKKNSNHLTFKIPVNGLFIENVMQPPSTVTCLFSKNLPRPSKIIQCMWSPVGTVQSWDCTWVNPQSTTAGHQMDLASILL